MKLGRWIVDRTTIATLTGLLLLAGCGPRSDYLPHPESVSEVVSIVFTDASVVFYVPTRTIKLESFVVALDIAVPTASQDMDDVVEDAQERIAASNPDISRMSIDQDSTVKAQPISSHVSAQLIGDKFDIELISPERQKVSPSSPGEWSWQVTPLAPGNHTLSVRIDNLAESGGKLELVNSSTMNRKVSVRDPEAAVLTGRTLRSTQPATLPATFVQQESSGTLPKGCTVTPGPSQGVGRYALLIGNQNYPWAPLSKPHEDVDQLSDVLAAENFLVIACKDLGRMAFEAALQYLFETTRADKRPSSDKVALIYFSGHGLGGSNLAQPGAEDNFLVPVDYDLRNAPGASDDDLADVSISLAWVSVALRAGTAGDVDTAMFIVDSCRAPVEDAVADKGLGRMNWSKEDGRIFLYATDYGKTTPDNGLFAATLADRIRRNGDTLQADHLLIETAKDVYRATSGRQNPQIEGQYRQRFWFDYETWRAAKAED